MSEAPPFTTPVTKKQKTSPSNRAERCFNEILTHSRDIIIKRGFEADTYDFITPSVTKLMGYTPDDKPMADLDHRLEMIHPEDRKRVKLSTDELLKDRSVVSEQENQFRIKKLDGSYIWVDEIFTLVRGDDGKPDYFISNCRDITGDKASKIKLREKETQYEAIFEAATDAIIVFDEVAHIRDVNPIACIMYGYTKDEFTMLTLYDIVSPAYHYLINTFQIDLFKLGKFNASSVDVCKDGSLIDTEVKCFEILFGGKQHYIAIARDVTERKRMERDLRIREEQYRSIFNAATDAVFIINQEGQFVEANPQATKMYGYTREEFLHQTVYDIVHPDYHPEFESFKKNMRTSGHSVNSTIDVCKDGSWVYTEVKGTEFQYRGEGHFLTIVRDITERKEAEKTLRESEDRFRKLTEMLPQSIFEMDEHFNITFLNENAQTSFKMNDLTLHTKGVKFLDLIAPEDHHHIHRSSLLIQEGKSAGLAELSAVKQDGTRFPAMVRIAARQREGQISGFIGFCIDITQQKKLEAQFRQAQKMEGLGTLAGGIAHDFNNLLTGIQGHTSLMSSGLNHQHPHLEHLEGIETMVQRGKDLTGQLLGFAQGGKYQVVATEINDLLDKSATLFNRTKKEITIHRSYDKNIYSVEVDQGQIEQVLLNLFVNASQAMPGGGDLYIGTENVILTPEDVEPHHTTPGEFVKISVTDSGVGIEKEIQRRIFEPFFTTKDTGKGTGLGLAAAYGIIQNHNGIINVYSEVGKGSTFNVYLPASDKSPLPKPTVKENLVTGNETILLVDDEEIILEVGSELLKSLGYTVITAENGKKALEVFRSRPTEIALVVLDMVMPEMGGSDVFDQLKGIKSDVKVLLSSGYSLNGQASAILQRGCAGFIQKPFHIRQLSKKIRDVLIEGSAS